VPLLVCRCCRELLEHLQLIERPPAIRTRSRPWRLLPHQAGVAAAAVAALLRAEKPAAQWTPATAGMGGEGSEAKDEGDEEDGQSRGGRSTSLAQQPQQAAGLDTAGAAGAAAQPAAWPIQFSPSIEAELQKRHMGTQRYRRRIQRYAASVLHTLLQVRCLGKVKDALSTTWHEQSHATCCVWTNGWFGRRTN